MAPSGRRPLTGGEALSGRIAGTVLQAVRQAAGLTQVDLAEITGTGLTTVQGWETGRRRLINVQHRELCRIRRRLQIAGASTLLLRLLEPALRADMILAEISTPEPELHPLALLVPDRTLTEMLAWPISGTPPRQMLGTRAHLPVGAGVREHLVAQLRDLADRAPATTPAGAMLRRQAQFLIASHPGSRDWLGDAVRRDLKQARLSDWSVQWPVARSHAVSAAIAGDTDPLRRFTEEGLATEQGTAANLTYWAYWVGEIGDHWVTDREMLQHQQSWSGEPLLASLLDGVMRAPYRELCAHTLWALVRVKRGLVADPAIAAQVASTVDAALAAGLVSDGARRKLEQVDYLVRSR